MNKIENTKIEKRAIRALEGPIIDSDYLDSSFNSMDKELSWDGYIYVFNEVKFSNKSFDDKIPVQIKGKWDAEQKEINKQRIQFPIDLDVLENYYNDRGVLYFRVLLSNNKAEIFYDILFPSKIKMYLDEAKKKKNKKQINVVLCKMKQTPEEMRRICKQFIFESHKQGSGRGQIVPKSVNVKQLHEYNKLQATAFGTASPYEFIQRVSVGDVCFYANNEKSDIWYPVEIEKGIQMFIKQEVNQPIRIGDKIFYKKYEVITGTDDERIIKLSKNLILNWNTGKFNFEKKSSLSELANDAAFLLDLKNSQELYIGNFKLPYSNPKLDNDLEDDLNFIINLNSICIETNIVIETSFEHLTEGEIQSMLRLVEIYRGKLLINEQQLYTYDLWISGKVYLFIICKQEGKIIFANRIYESKYQGYVRENNNFYKVPLFSELRGNVLAYLYKYDYAELVHQVDNTDINHYTFDTLNYSVIGLIEAYDKNGNKKLLDLAQYIVEKILTVNDGLEYVKINRWQIKKRVAELDDTDKQELNEILESTDNLQIKCGACALLNRKAEANDYLQMMSEEDREILRGFPIGKYL